MHSSIIFCGYGTLTHNWPFCSNHKSSLTLFHSKVVQVRMLIHHRSTIMLFKKPLMDKFDERFDAVLYWCILRTRIIPSPEVQIYVWRQASAGVQARAGWLQSPTAGLAPSPLLCTLASCQLPDIRPVPDVIRTLTHLYKNTLPLSMSLRSPSSQESESICQ